MELVSWLHVLLQNLLLSMLEISHMLLALNSAISTVILLNVVFSAFSQAYKLFASGGGKLHACFAKIMQITQVGMNEVSKAPINPSKSLYNI